MRRINERPQWSGLMMAATWEKKQAIAEALNYFPHPKQLEFHSRTERFKVPCCGRRFGKSHLCAFEACFCAIMGGWCMTCAPTYNLANKVFYAALMMLEASGFKSMITDRITQEGKQMVRLSSGGIIAAKSTDNPKSLVGDGWDLVIFDEAALEESPEPWRRSLRPALADRRGSAIFPSTPNGDNWYKDIYDMGQSPDFPEWWSMTYASSANPIMTDDEIRSMTEGMSRDWVNQEIYAKFLGSGGGVFKTFHEVSDFEWQEDPLIGHLYCGGLDLGKHEDYTVMAVWDSTIGGLVHMTRLNRLPFPDMEKVVLAELSKWQCPMICDTTREESVADRLRENCWWSRIDGFKFLNENKTKIMNQLALGFDDGIAHLLNDNTELGRLCYQEFSAYRYERLPSGVLRMSHPPGKHDDIVDAVALAYECNLRYMGITTAAIYQPHSLAGADPMTGQFTVDKLHNTVIGARPQPKFRL